MAEITYQMILSTLQTVGLLVGIFYYIITLNNTRKNQQITIETRRTQIFLHFYGTITPEQIKRTNELLNWEWNNYDDFKAKYWSKIDERSKLVSVFERFQGIGLLAENDQLDLDLAYKLMNVIVVFVWNKFESVILKRREILQRPERFRGFEFLYNEMMKRRLESSTDT
jgi:hypothetical protein